MTKQIKIYDTTLRDGAQSVGVTFSCADKLRITQVLDDFGIHYIEGGWPGSNPKDVAFFSAAKKIQFKQARLAAFSSTKLARIKIREDENIRRLIAAETPVATIFGKAWDFHVKKALGVELVENLDMIFTTIDYLKKYFAEVIFDAEHFFDGYKANPEYAMQTLETARAAGCDWIVLCDTNGGAMLNECARTIKKVKALIALPLGIHAHNDADLAVANSLLAVKGGCTMVQGTINGLGERCGNANLCSVIPNLTLKENYRTIPGAQMQKLYYVSHLVSELSNQAHNHYMAYTGSRAFAHKGGIHVSAVSKDSRTYEHIAPELVGNKRSISISELSGKSNILAKAGEMGIAAELAGASAKKVLQHIKELENKGYHFEGAEASYELLYKSLLGRLKEYFHLHGYRVIISKDTSGKTWSEATIKGSVPEDICRQNHISEPLEHTSADAGGPVEALDRALRKVLEKFYPALKEVKLTDYKVRILNEDAGTKATTRVLINSTDGRRSWGTVGLSDNIIDASWQALLDAFVYKISKDEEEKEKKHDKKNQDF